MSKKMQDAQVIKSLVKGFHFNVTFLIITMQ